FGLETRWAIKDASDFIGYILHNVIVPYKELQAKIEAKADKDNYQSVLNEINTNIEEIKTDINNVVFKEGEYEINPYAPGEKYNKVPTYIKKLEETKKHEEAIEPVAAEIKKLSDKVAELETKDNKADYAAEITWINEQVNTLNTELNQVTDFSKLAEITTKATNTITELNNGQTLLEQIIKDHKEALSKFEALKTESKKVAPFEPYYEHSVKTIELLVPKSETEFNKYLGSFTDVLELHKQINGKSDFKFDAQIYAVLEITDKFVKTVIQRYVATYFGLMLRFGNNLKNEAQVKENLNLIYHVLSSLYDVYEGELYISNVDYNKILSEFQKDLMKVMMANMPMPPRP
uniref:hypothetical protein n=1 Tax=Mycoplasmopsis felifaucium TaxID=35768 RepID=UPI000567B386